MKRVIAIVIAMLIAAAQIAAGAEAADNSLIQLGTYIQLGRYNDEPILWRCIDNDENGKLILSDKILCLKTYDKGSAKDEIHPLYGNGFWEESNIRAWLNATELAGNIYWPSGYAPSGKPMNNGTSFPYDTEDGFLSPTNFTDSELSVMKTTAQWQILSSWNKELSTNGVKHVFQSNALIYGDGKGDRGFLYSDVTNLNHVEGAMYRLNDTMFLLDVRQVYKLWSNFGTVAAYPTNKLLNSIDDNSEFIEDGGYRYCLRTSVGYETIYVYGDTGYNSFLSDYNYGIRPAFYLNEDNFKIVSGSGTEADPYVVDGISAQTGTAVFAQGKQLPAAQTIEQNGEMLVSVRDVFEAFGADVQYYDEEDGIITATSAERTVVLQAGNPEIGNGTEVFTLKTAPVIINDRAMISLEGVENAYGCTTEYISNLERLVIDKPVLPMDFGDGIGREDWQQPWYKEIYKNK